jgi:hypothetical protein
MAKRVSITLTDREYQILADYAKVFSDLPTSVVSHLVKEMLPRYEILIKARLLVEAGKFEEAASLANTLVLRAINDASSASVELQEEIQGL